MSIYFKKYLKYKNKYLKLQKIIQTEEFIYANSNSFKGGAWEDKKAVNKLKQRLETKPKKVAINSNVDTDKLLAKAEADNLLAKAEVDKLQYEADNLQAKSEADNLQANAESEADVKQADASNLQAKAETDKLQANLDIKNETIEKIYNNIVSSDYLNDPIIQLIYNLDEIKIHTLYNQRETDLFEKPIFKYFLCYNFDITSDSDIKKNYILTQKIILFVIGYINQVLFDNNYKIQYIIKGGTAFKFILSMFRFIEAEEQLIKNKLEIPTNECLFKSNDIDLIVRIDHKIDQNIKKCLCLVLLYKLYKIIFLSCNNIIYKSPSDRDALHLSSDIQERNIESQTSASHAKSKSQERNIESQSSASHGKSHAESTIFSGVHKLSLKHSIFDWISPKVLIDINPDGNTRNFFKIDLHLPSGINKNKEFVLAEKIILYIEPISDFLKDKEKYYLFYQTQEPVDSFNLIKFQKYVNYFKIIKEFRPQEYINNFMDFNFNFYSIYCPGIKIPFINLIKSKYNIIIGPADSIGGRTISIYPPNIEQAKEEIKQIIEAS